MSYTDKYAETFNADDEEPKCINCDHVCNWYGQFCSECGPEYGWHNYIRTEIHEIEYEEDTK